MENRLEDRLQHHGITSEEPTTATRVPTAMPERTSSEQEYKFVEISDRLPCGNSLNFILKFLFRKLGNFKERFPMFVKPKSIRSRARKIMCGRFVVLLLCACGLIFAAQASLSEFERSMIDAQRKYFAQLTDKNGTAPVANGMDVQTYVRNFAAQYLPKGLEFIPGSESVPMDDAAGKVGRALFSDVSGARHLFSAWVTAKLQKPFCWAAEGYVPQQIADVRTLKAFLSATVLTAQSGGKYELRALPTAVEATNVVVKGAFTGKMYSIPYDRAFVVFVDDAPLDNWGHPCRYVFVKDDLSEFVVWFASEPMAVESSDGKAQALERIGENIELPPPPTLNEIKAELKKFDAQTLEGSELENIVCSGGDTSHSYAVLISGGYDIYNNHTRYWGDVSAMYSTLTKKYGIPKGNIKVCMSDGTSSLADLSMGFSSSSHSYFTTGSSPLDLDGDGSADVNYNATKTTIQSLFSSLRNTLTSNDQLFVFVTDHGSQEDDGSCYVCLWNNGLMSVSEFAALTSGMSCPVSYALEFCYSGAFISTLRNQSGSRAVATAASTESSSAWNRTSTVTGIGYSTGIYYMNPWVYYFVAATRGYFPSVSVSPWNDSSSCTVADTSGDGRVSIKEASNYAKSKIEADGYPETPTYGESSSGIGSSLFLVKNLNPAAQISLATAMDSSLAFSTGGNSPAWFGQNAVKHDGVDAARSGQITDNQTNWVQTVVSGAGTISFWWYVDSEASYDYLEFLIDGVVQDGISGTGNSWQYKTYSVRGSGSHTLRWRYRKDSSRSVGQDAGFVDQVTWTRVSTLTTITFGKNGGTGGSNSVTATYDESLPSITVPTRAGYEFGGYWDTTGSGGKKYYNANGTSARNWDKNVTSTTIWALWTRDVTLQTALDTQLQISTGGSTPIWYGQTATSWDGVDAARSGAITDSQSTWMQSSVSGAGTVSFYWKVSSEADYDFLEFLIDEQVMASISGTNTTSWAYKSFAVSGSGTHVLKWRYRKDGSVSRGQDAGFVDRIGWTGPLTYTVTFGKNAGVGGESSVSATYGAPLPRITPPSRTGYMFDGYWTTVNPGGVKYINADGTSARNWDKTIGTTLWAKWLPTYTVTFGKNGGTGGTGSAKAAVGKPMPTIIPPVRTGYTFGGYWTTVNSGGVKYINADGTSAHNWDKSANLTLWALWTRPANITFGKNGGSGGSASVTGIYGQPLPRIVVPSRAGYVFDGYWTTVNSGGVKYYSADGSGTRNWDMSVTSTTLWAKWTRVTTVTLGRNGGTGGTTQVSAAFGKPVPGIVIPVRTGYIFGGYWTTTSAGGVKYINADGTSARNWDKNVSTFTLWALWERRYTVTFGKNGGTGGSSSVVVTYGRPMPQITIPSRPGYLFGGYYTTIQPGGVQYYNDDGSSAHNWDKTGNLTLWAFWTPIYNVLGNGLCMGAEATALGDDLSEYGFLSDGSGSFVLRLQRPLRENGVQIGTFEVDSACTDDMSCLVFSTDDLTYVMTEAGDVYVLTWQGLMLIAVPMR